MATILHRTSGGGVDASRPPALHNFCGQLQQALA